MEQTNQTTSTASKKPYHTALIALLQGLDFQQSSTPAQVLGLAKLGETAFIPAPARSNVIAAWTETQTQLADVIDPLAQEATAQIDKTITAIEQQRKLDNGTGGDHVESGVAVIAGAELGDQEQQQLQQS